MPGFGEGPSTSLEDQDDFAASAPVTQGMRYGEEFGHWDAFQEFARVADRIGAAATQTLGGDPGADETRPVSADELNARFGVPGYLRFNAPGDAADAAFQQHMAFQHRFRDEVLSRSDPNMLFDLGSSLAGAITDPVNVGIWAATDGLGEAVLGARGAGAAADAAATVGKTGRVWNLAAGTRRLLAEGAIANAPYVGASAALAPVAGDDYDFGDALRDLSAGAVLHSGLHLALKAAGVFRAGLDRPMSLAEARAKLAALRGETPASATEIGPGVDFNAEPRSRDDLMGSTALSTPYVPAAVDALPAPSRLAAWALALDRARDDEPVDVGAMIQRALEPPALSRLDEPDALTELAGWRPAEDATAVTTRGTEIPVRYGLAELSDLTTSHTDDLQPNPDFPPELQPPDRARAGSMARNLQLEAELNPMLLMSDVGAGSGAPIVGPDGVVESGNGRTIALRRAAAKGSDAYGRYRAALEAAGYDTTGMQAPALVRMRTEPMTGAQRAALAREMNADVVERMSATEQAMADAARMPDQIWDEAEDGRAPTTSRAFIRAFIDRVAPDQVASFVGGDGRLSPDGARRIRAALLAKAYGDPHLVGQIFEGVETAARRLGEALADAAPGWAKMRALARSGQIPRLLDLTPALQSAMDLVRYAAREGKGVGEILAERLGQAEMFGGEISPFTEAFLRLFYRDAAMKRPTAAEKISWALKDYARQAGQVTPGQDLFGATPDETTARAILANAADKIARGDAGELDTLRPTGPSRPGSQPREAPLVDLREPGRPGERGPGDVSRPGERPAGADSLRPEQRGSEGAQRSSGQSIIAADPELKALAADTERLAAENGLALDTKPAEAPDTIADAIRAAGVCLAEEIA